ncbi:hypothetical protein L873DRAFT_1794868 [Choiromyces venosus 120613-1]|uniref:GTP cyclohydrolase N-terminal domain-containing protein n=1 Tax=Choiromyces venosus 120613-1 TaxID=1336337 RepID=A0A3N4IZ85_9PEZI|nr:hypothetical protein L873DRAFT_1794868 [Choiromyces venosus 120613-1]
MMVAIDPWGHFPPSLYNGYVNNGNVKVHSTIAITKTYVKVPQLEPSIMGGSFKIGTKLCLNQSGWLGVTKFEVKPIWYASGVEKRTEPGRLNNCYLTFSTFLENQLKLLTCTYAYW